MRDLISRLKKTFRGEARGNEPLAAHTSFGIGGRADLWAEPEDVDALRLLLEFLKEEDVPSVVFGNGTNLLVKDEGVRGAVVSMKRLCDFSFSAGEVHAEAGAPLRRILKQCARRGLSGLEFASGIPASIGGAAVLNAGGRFGEIKDVLRGAVLLSNGKLIKAETGELGLGYRKSGIDGGKKIIISVDLELTEKNPSAVKKKIASIMKYRKETQPVNPKSAGCIFKNPGSMSAGVMISEAGLGGRRIGGAEISSRHGNYIINRGGASSDDVLSLICLAEEEVFKLFGVSLEREVEIIGA